MSEISYHGLEEAFSGEFSREETLSRDKIIEIIANTSGVSRTIGTTAKSMFELLISDDLLVEVGHDQYSYNPSKSDKLL